MSLHPIDTQKSNWTDDELDKMFIFCMLDRAMPYEKVCNAFDNLDKNNLSTRKGLKKILYPFKDVDYVANVLRETGFRFPNQTAKFLILFAMNPIDLRTADRDTIVKNVKGIGYKLASMFLRNTRGLNYAVIDIHIKRYLTEQGYNINKNYKAIEKDFMNVASKLNRDPYELDMAIWQERRIGNRK
jgi:thermostable 8-oxoguanine DNA glycosylase